SWPGKAGADFLPSDLSITSLGKLGGEQKRRSSWGGNTTSSGRDGGFRSGVVEWHPASARASAHSQRNRFLPMSKLSALRSPQAAIPPCRRAGTIAALWRGSRANSEAKLANRL